MGKNTEVISISVVSAVRQPSEPRKDGRWRLPETARKCRNAPVRTSSLDRPKVTLPHRSSFAFLFPDGGYRENRPCRGDARALHGKADALGNLLCFPAGGGKQEVDLCGRVTFGLAITSGPRRIPIFVPFRAGTPSILSGSGRLAPAATTEIDTTWEYPLYLLCVVGGCSW